MLATIDWIIIAVYVLFALGIGLFYSARASKSKEEFFLSGRSLPWWLVGTSMAATNFAADTPLAVTGLVAKQGVSGVWFLWNGAIGAILATFFFARLWRRAEVVTDAEIIEMRYGGKSAEGLRLLKGFYFGVMINCYVMGWVMVAMTKIMDAALGWDKVQTMAIFAFITIAYTILSGFWGVVVTDFVQYFLALFGSISLAALSLKEVGGLGMLREKLTELYGSAEVVLSPLPTEVTGASMVEGLKSLDSTTFFVFFFVQWWAQKYADGGGKVIQRMSSAKNERQAVLGTLWFAVTTFGLQVWPWIVTALVTLVLYPNMADPEFGYPKVMMQVLPAGLLGVMVISLVGAFMSTIDTHLNLGASYVVNDIYERFLRPGSSQAHLVKVSRLSMVLLMAIACLIAWKVDSIAGAWKFIMAFSAGAGPTFIARWLWWRPNAWTEMAGMVASGIFATYLRLTYPEMTHGELLLWVVPLSAVCWLAATFLTKPVDDEVLERFYRKVRPGTPWWGEIGRRCADMRGAIPFGKVMVMFVTGVAALYTICFGTGRLALGGSTAMGLGMVIAGLAVIALLVKRSSKD